MSASLCGSQVVHITGALFTIVPTNLGRVWLPLQTFIMTPSIEVCPKTLFWFLVYIEKQNYPQPSNDHHSCPLSFMHVSHHFVSPSQKQKKESFCVISEQKKCITKTSLFLRPLILISDSHSVFISVVSMLSLDYQFSYPSTNETSFRTSALLRSKINTSVPSSISNTSGQVRVGDYIPQICGHDLTSLVLGAWTHKATNKQLTKPQIMIMNSMKRKTAGYMNT